MLYFTAIRFYRFYHLRQYLRTTSLSYARCISQYNPRRVSWFYFSPDSITYCLCTIAHNEYHTRLRLCRQFRPLSIAFRHGDCACRAVTSLIPSSINYSSLLRTLFMLPVTSFFSFYLFYTIIYIRSIAQYF